jgi:hypothetical protein
LSFGSLDYPPHHISRWAEEQLESVAHFLDATLLSISKQPLDKSQTIGALRLKELPGLLPHDFPGRTLLINVTSRLMVSFPLSVAYRRLALTERFGMYGHSLVALLRKPSDDRPRSSGSSQST